MSARNFRYAVFVALHCTVAIWAILEIADRAIARQDTICQEGCE